jgi:hypothetical protein
MPVWKGVNFSCPSAVNVVNLKCPGIIKSAPDTLASQFGN